MFSFYSRCYSGAHSGAIKADPSSQTKRFINHTFIDLSLFLCVCLKWGQDENNFLLVAGFFLFCFFKLIMFSITGNLRIILSVTDLNDICLHIIVFFYNITTDMAMLNMMMQHHLHNTYFDVMKAEQSVSLCSYP